MNPSEQERLFKRVRRRFRQWSKRQCSGYVHGIADHERGLDPSEDMIHALENPYARGYIFGYADAHGSDAEYECWYPFTWGCDYRWWQEE